VLNERKKKILNAIIKDYQRTAEPVGSRTITKTHLHDLSPATIRNEMADLEEEGYIEQPHTSAGRIPTDIGYRFYVDRLMRITRPTVRETQVVKSYLHKSSPALDEILHQTAKILSHTLDYTAIVVNLGSHRRLFSSGASNLLRQPEFKDVRHMQQLLELIEEEEELAEVVEEYTKNQDLTIKIGSENATKRMKECSMVVSSFKVEDEIIGAIGLIGPTRMYYSKASTLIDYVAHELSDVLSAGDIF